jgi:short subunit dehydrogenase-like uncharacterized protein
MDTAARAYEVALFGASGFTGQLVAEHLARTAPDLRWALAGRSRAKLQEVQARLARDFPAASRPGLLIADAADAPALAQVAQQAAVVCTTVGPYGLYGGPLAAACAEAGTGYCDLTGETPFVRESIDRNHAKAEATGARIVHCCGFDSIPSDLGVLLLGDEYRRRGGRLASASFFVGPLRGTASGGTIASLLHLFDRATREPQIRRLMGDPYALLPDRSQRGPDRGDQASVRFDPLVGEWTAPFVMAAINTRIVRRSQALLGHPHGPGFRYREVMSCGRGPRGLLRATSTAAGVAALVGTASFAAGRALLQRLLPAPGQGPSRAEQEAGHFRVRVVGEGTGADGAPLSLTALVVGKRDPGYGQTAQMLGETALCLARDGARLPGRGGVLTPATGLGQPLIDRLRAVGMTLSVQ